MGDPRKTTHLTRKNYYLSLQEKLFIREYIHANPNLSYQKIGDHFGISRATVSNINRIPYHKEHYDKMIFDLTNLKNQMASRISVLEREIIGLKTKLSKYE
jgi:uncharacterized protein YerC